MPETSGVDQGAGLKWLVSAVAVVGAAQCTKHVRRSTCNGALCVFMSPMLTSEFPDQTVKPLISATASLISGSRLWTSFMSTCRFS